MSDIRMEPLKSTVSDKELRRIADLCGKAEADKLLYGDWKYENIMQNGSDELVEVVFLITGGIAPGGRDNEKAIIPTLSNLARNDYRHSS